MTLVHPYLAATGDDGAGRLPVVMGTAVVVLLVLAGIRGRELRPRRLFTVPGVVVLLGIAALLPQLSGRLAPHGIDVVLAIVDLALSVGLGAVRGRTVRIYLTAGTPWYRYGPVTVLLWGLSITLRFGLGVYGAHHGASPLVTSTGIILMLGLTLLAQNTIVFARAASRTGHRTPDEPDQPTTASGPPGTASPAAK